MDSLEATTVARVLSLTAVRAALDLLHQKLPKDLLYHSYSHTEDVIGEVVRLALLDGLPTRDIELLAIAAAWHDVGFCFARQANEPIAAAEARKTLLALGGLSSDELVTIERMILDTALVSDGTSLKQNASIPLSCYLLDADLANFGRDDFFAKSELQRQELGEDLAIFSAKTLALLQKHSWLTPAAKHLWTASKEHNVHKLAHQVRAQ